MQMLHFRVPTSCNGMRLNIFLRTMGVSSACIKAVNISAPASVCRWGWVIPVHTRITALRRRRLFRSLCLLSLHRCSTGAAAY